MSNSIDTNYPFIEIITRQSYIIHFCYNYLKILAFFERGPINIISVDYMGLAKDPCYITAVINVPLIGKCSAQLVEALVTKRGIPLENFHVLGFSLGAQVAGAVGSHMEIGQLERITGFMKQ